MTKYLWVLSPLFFLGVPSLVAAVALARWLKSWRGAMLLLAGGLVVFVLCARQVPEDGEGVGLALAIMATTNLLAWIAGVVVTTVVVRRRRPA